MSLLIVSGIRVIQQGFELKHISFTQQRYQKIAITGETGSGKSTLMKTIAGLIQPADGTITFENEPVTGPDFNLIAGHPGIAYLSQRFELRNHYRMEELMSYSNTLPEEQTKEIFSLCKIEHLLKRKTEGLSGGEQQRLALARLLLGAPKLLLLDEPFSNLDLIHKNILKGVIEAIGAQLGTSCILTSHDPLDTLSWADEILVMRNGTIVQTGKPEEVYYNPADEYVAGLFGSYNKIDKSLHQMLDPAGDKRNNDFWLIRPEHLILSDDGQGIKATVTNIAFHGSYFEIEAQALQQILRIRTLDNLLNVGNTVYISLRTNPLS